MSSPAFAAELSKADVDKNAAVYIESYTKKDANAIGTLFTKDGVHVNPAGIRNVVEYYGEVFKAGFDKLETSVDQIDPLTADTGIAIGQFTISGKNDKGEPLKVSGRFSQVLVNEGGAWKIRMLTAVPIPPPKTN